MEGKRQRFDLYLLGFYGEWSWGCVREGDACHDSELKVDVCHDL